MKRLRNFSFFFKKIFKNTFTVLMMLRNNSSSQNTNNVVTTTLILFCLREYRKNQKQMWLLVLSVGSYLFIYRWNRLVKAYLFCRYSIYVRACVCMCIWVCVCVCIDEKRMYEETVVKDSTYTYIHCWRI